MTCLHPGSNHPIYSAPGMDCPSARQRALREVDMTTDAGDLFPPAPRVFYRKAPLVQVTCQLRFQPILRITAPPADFQERIRRQFPLLERVPSVDLPIQLPPGVMDAIQDTIWRLALPQQKIGRQRSRCILSQSALQRLVMKDGSSS